MSKDVKDMTPSERGAVLKEKRERRRKWGTLSTPDGTNPDDSGDGEGDEEPSADGDALSGGVSEELQELVVRANLMADRTPEHAEALRAEAADLAGVEEFAEIPGIGDSPTIEGLGGDGKADEAAGVGGTNEIGPESLGEGDNAYPEGVSEERVDALEARVSDEYLRELKGETVDPLTQEDVTEALRQFDREDPDDGEALTQKVEELTKKANALNGRVSEEHHAAIEWKRDALAAASEAHAPYKANSDEALAKRADVR